MHGANNSVKRGRPHAALVGSLRGYGGTSHQTLGVTTVEEEQLCLVFVPALVAILVTLKTKKLAFI